jgi:hypothetical protein
MRALRTTVRIFQALGRLTDRLVPVGRSRQPLPDQTTLYIETGRYGRPPPPPSSMPPMSARFSDASLGPKDANPPPVQRLPSGPRSARPPPLQPMQVDNDDAPSRRDAQPTSRPHPHPHPHPNSPTQPTSSHPQGPPPALAGPAAPIRAGSGMYADREAAAAAPTDGGAVPKGPRAMSASTPSGSSFGYGSGGGPPSATDGGYGRGRGREREREKERDRSPPPHISGAGERMNTRGGDDFYRGRGVRAASLSLFRYTHSS